MQQHDIPELTPHEELDRTRVLPDPVDPLEGSARLPELRPEDEPGPEDEPEVPQKPKRRGRVVRKIVKYFLFLVLAVAIVAAGGIGYLTVTEYRPAYAEDAQRGNVLREGKDVAIFATGLMVSESLAAAEKLAKEGIDAAVINIHTIKPIDAECVTKYAVQCGKVITVEEHSVIGGLGDAVADVLMGKVNCKFHKIGVNDRFGQSGKAADVLREYGLTADQIAETVKANI